MKAIKRFMTLDFFALCYIYVGVLLWLIGWVKPLFSIPAIGLLLLGLFMFAKDTPPRGGGIKRPVLILCAVVIFIWAVLCGNGGFFSQAGDWIKHNAILNDLISKEWPVYYHNDNSSAMLTYYIGQYMLPAVAGKLTNSFRVAELAMLIWNFIGAFLTVLLLFRLTKANTWRKQIFALLVFMFFSNVLFLSQALYTATDIGANDTSVNIYHWLGSIRIQFRSIISSFRYIPTNGPPAWIAAALFAERLDSPRYYLLFIAPLLLHASLPFCGLALLMLGIFMVKLILPGALSSDRLNYLKECVSVPNLCVLAVLMIELVYLVGNVGGEKPAALGFSFSDFGTNSILYFCFCAGFVCYSATIFPVFKRTPLFYVVNGILFLFPFFRYGLYNDFCMNASIPVIFLLMTFVIQGFFQFTSTEGSQPGRAAILILLLVWGSIYPTQELKINCKNGPAWDGSARWMQWESMNDRARRDGTVSDDIAYNYYTYDYEQSQFYVWLAKNK